jgi:hypothetical protein
MYLGLTDGHPHFFLAQVSAEIAPMHIAVARRKCIAYAAAFCLVVLQRDDIDQTT